MFISGTRLWPPARIEASGPNSASAATASSTVSAARYANLAGFTARSSSPGDPTPKLGKAREHLLRGDRQAADPDARRRVDRVADRCRDGRCPRLADPVDATVSGRVLGEADRPALGQVLERRDRVVGEARVDDLSRVELDLLEERLADPECDVPLALQGAE